MKLNYNMAAFKCLQDVQVFCNGFNRSTIFGIWSRFIIGISNISYFLNQSVNLTYVVRNNEDIVQGKGEAY